MYYDHIEIDVIIVTIKDIILRKEIIERYGYKERSI